MLRRLLSVRVAIGPEDGSRPHPDEQLVYDSLTLPAPPRRRRTLRLWMEMCEGWGAGCCCRGHHTIGRYLSAGDTIMTHVSLLHSGSPNRSNSKRYFFSVYYNISCERLCV
jgi:hypothetical protein